MSNDKCRSEPLEPLDSIYLYMYGRHGRRRRGVVHLAMMLVCRVGRRDGLGGEEAWEEKGHWKRRGMGVKGHEETRGKGKLDQKERKARDV